MTYPERAAQIWPLLTFCASMRRVVTYQEVGALVGTSPRSVGKCLAPILAYCVLNRKPPLTSLVVTKSTGLPGAGFDAAEDVPGAQAKTFAYDWTSCKVPSSAELEAAQEQLDVPGN